MNALRTVLNREIGTTGTPTTRQAATSAAVQAGTKFQPPPPGTIPNLAIIKVTSAATGGGFYNGTAYVAGATITTSSTDLSTTKLEGRSIGTVIAVSFAEVGTSNHDLTHADNTSQKYFMGVQIGRSGSYPLFVLLGNAAWFDTCE